VVLRLPCHICADIALEKLVSVVSESRCDCIALSGGIDTSVILLATRLAGLKPRGYVAFYRGGVFQEIFPMLSTCLNSSVLMLNM